MASQYLSKGDTWQSVLADELMEKNTITPRTLSILKDNHEYCDPNILMNLRHDKSAYRTPKRKRESISSIMEEARRNLKTEYNEKASGAMHKKMIDSEVQKFKQHLARLKRINSTSNRPLARKPLRVRFQKMTIRSRSCGSSVTRPKRSRDSVFKYPGDRELNLPNTSDSLFGLPLDSQLHCVIGSPSAESIDSDMSLPAVYGNSMCETADIQKAPNTTPISFCSGVLPRRRQDTETKAESFLLEEEFFPDDFCEGDSAPSSPEPPRTKNECESTHNCAECAQRADFVSYDNGNNNRSCNSKEEAPVHDFDAASKTENERKRKVRNSAYKQFMSYVCNKSIRATQKQNASSAKVSSEAGKDETVSKREEKIAKVLGYLQRKKSSPDSPKKVTSPEPVTKTKITQSTAPVSDAKTARANGGPYEHRYQAQRDLIKKQKMQLEEQQKQIQELTLTKLQEEAKNSQKDFQKTIEELEENCTLSIRPQLKTLKGTGSLPDFSSASKIVERMEKRAKEREERKQIAAERRRVLEEERKKRMREEEEKRRKEEEDRKREAFEKIREENIRQRELRERTRKEQERMLELHKRAEFFNRRRLLKIGYRAFKLLLIRRNELAEKAEEYYTIKIMKYAFFQWKRWVDNKVSEKVAVADAFYNRILLRSSFNCWKEELIDAIRKRQVADDMYEMRLQERVFRKWSQYVNEQHLKMSEKLATADQYYTWVLLKKTFNRWRAYPKVAHLERAKEQRKIILRKKVQEMLPDFRPVSPHF